MARNQACSPAIQLPAGTATVTEVGQPGAVVTDVSTAPAARLISHSQGSRSATVAVVEGSVSTQTVVTFTNSFEIGQLKLCKVAGTGIATGTNFVFMVGAQAVNVPDGPTPGGFCSVAGSFPAGTDHSITESPSAGVAVMAIAVEPASRLSGAADIAGGPVNVSIGTGATEVPAFEHLDLDPRAIHHRALNPSCAAAVSRLRGQVPGSREPVLRPARPRWARLPPSGTRIWPARAWGRSGGFSGRSAWSFSGGSCSPSVTPALGRPVSPLRRPLCP